PATAAPGLRSPLALAWRLHRGLLASWTLGFAVLGIVFGGVAKGVGDMMDGNQALQEIMLRLGGKAGIIDAYLAAILNLLGLIAAGYAVQAALKLRAEESAGHAEPLLAGAVGRFRWAASHLLFSALGPVLALVTAGVATGLVYGASVGEVGRQVPRALAGAVLQIPAVWVLAAVAVLLIGLLPRLAGIAWGALAVCVLLGLVGASLQLNQRLLDVSPFVHIPKVPGGTFSATPLVWLTAVAVLLGGAGLAGLRRRDVPTA
ncbi:ABC transporter permease, partial [Micromonospora zhanjiangensis]